MYDVAILHNIVLTFLAPLAGILRASFAVELYVVVIGDDFCLDKTPLKVSMDDSGCLGRADPRFYRPGSCFLGTAVK